MRFTTFEQKRNTRHPHLNRFSEIQVFKTLGKYLQDASRYFNQHLVRQASDAGPASRESIALKNVDHALNDRPARARPQGLAVPGVLKSAKNIGLAFALACPLCAQTSISLYQVTSATTSSNFNNTNPKYNSWTVMYNYSGSGSFSIELDCAADATAAGGSPTPGTFAACTNTKTGSNPSTTPNYGYITFVGYTPWVRLNLTALSGGGNMTAVAIAFTAADPESGSGGGSGCTGTISTPCIVGGNSNGANYTLEMGGASTAFTLSAGTDVKLVAGTSGKTTYLTRLTVQWDNAATATIRQGTTSSTPCDTSTTTIDGPYGNGNVTGLAIDYGSDFSPLTTTSTGLDICLHLSASVTGGGGASYNQH